MFSRHCAKPCYLQVTPWKSRGQPSLPQKPMAKKWIAKRSFPWSQSFLCCSIARFWQLFLHWKHQDLNRPNWDYRGSLGKQRAKSTLRIFFFLKGTWKILLTDVATSDWMVMTKGKPSQNHKELSLHFPAAAPADTSSGPVWCWNSDFTWLGWEPSPGLSNTLERCEINIHTIQYFQRQDWKWQTALKPFCNSLFSQEWKFLVGLKTTLISLILCATLRNLLNLIF